MRSECVFGNGIPLCPVPCVPISVSVIFWLFHGLLLSHMFFLIFLFYQIHHVRCHSQKTGIQVPQRRSRRSKVVQRLAELDNSSSPTTRRSKQVQDSQSDLSQSSQSQHSQGSQAGTPRSKELKKIIDGTLIEHSELAEMVIDEVHATVCMVKNRSTQIVKCKELGFSDWVIL